MDFRADGFADGGALRARWAAELAAMRAHLATLTDDDRAGPYRFTRQRTAHELPRWAIFAQLVTHSTQHRAEAAALLTDLGHSPDDLDFLFYMMASE